MRKAPSHTNPGVLVDVLSLLFTEELGAVIEIEKTHLAKVTAALSKHDISDITHIIGHTTKEKTQYKLQ